MKKINFLYIVFLLFSFQNSSAGGFEEENALVSKTNAGGFYLNVVLNNDVLCFGQSNGSASVQVSGGIPPYFFQWDNGEQSNFVVNLAAGVHTVTVTDAQGTQEVASLVVDEPFPLDVWVESFPTQGCGSGAVGSANAVVNGGTAPYTFSWSNGEVSQGATNLVVGPCQVVVTDSNGCSQTASLIIQEADALWVEVLGVSMATCNGTPDGVASITAGGGTAPYSYIWDNGGYTTEANNLSPGIHSVTVIDAGNCTAVISVEIKGVSSAVISASEAKQASCVGVPDGKALVEVGAGISPFTYLWDNGETTKLAANLMHGRHQVTVTDGIGCIKTTATDVTLPLAQPSMDVCMTTLPVEIVGGEGWVDILTADCELVASVFAPAGVDLGTVTAKYIHTSVITESNGEFGLKLLPRRMVLEATNSGPFSQQVWLRYYFMEWELANMNSAHVGINGPTNYLPAELEITQYFGPQQDCEYTNNILDSTYTETIRPSSKAYGSAHYLEFSVHRFSELIGHEPSDLLLPVNLAYFRGGLVDGASVLDWQSSMELNLSGYQIQKSKNGSDWMEVGFVEARGGLGQATQYQFREENPFVGVSYYRLMMMEEDNSLKYSNIVIITNVADDLITIGSLQPSLVTGGVVSLPVYSKPSSLPVEAQIFNAMGQLLHSEKRIVEGGDYSFQFEVGGWPPGAYFLVLETERDLFSRKFLVMK